MGILCKVLTSPMSRQTSTESAAGGQVHNQPSPAELSNLAIKFVNICGISDIFDHFCKCVFAFESNWGIIRRCFELTRAFFFYHWMIVPNGGLFSITILHHELDCRGCSSIDCICVVTLAFERLFEPRQGRQHPEESTACSMSAHFACHWGVSSTKRHSCSFR